MYVKPIYHSLTQEEHEAATLLVLQTTAAVNLYVERTGTEMDVCSVRDFQFGIAPPAHIRSIDGLVFSGEYHRRSKPMGRK